jgi:hypothetical protein
VDTIAAVRLAISTRYSVTLDFRPKAALHDALVRILATIIGLNREAPEWVSRFRRGFLMRGNLNPGASAMRNR